MATALDGFGFSFPAQVPAPPANTATFRLKGGVYGITYVTSGTPTTLELQRLALDGVTFVPVHTNVTATGATYLTATIPAGSYRIAQAGLVTENSLFAEVSEITSSP